MKIEKQVRWQRSAAVLACLLWMAIMVQFSTQLWNSAHTKAALDYLLTGIFPDVGLSLDRLNFGIRKTAHLTEYMVLTLMAFGAAVIGFQLSKTNALRLAMACAVLFAISDEWHQRFVPSRTSTPQDVMLDIAGACVVVLILVLLRNAKS